MIEDNSKQIFSNILNLKKEKRCPAALHWWGLYKYQALGLDYKKDAWREGDKLSQVYSRFYEIFKPDWFHLHIGTPLYFKDSEIVERDGRNWLAVDPGYREIKKKDKYFSVNCPDDEQIVDFPDYLLGSRSFKPKVDLSSKKKIDDYVKKYIHMSPQQIIELGYTDHVSKISQEYGRDVFIAVHIPSAVCEIFDPTTGYVGFEEGLIAFHDQPQGMRYLLERCYQEQLNWAKAYARTGAHAFIISESYISPDIAHPDIYRKFLKDIHADYFGQVREMGIFPLVMFWGDINPILKDLTQINIGGLLVEESKKGFTLDIEKIRESIGDKVCVFGNLDSITLLNRGRPEEVSAEVAAQIKCSDTPFAVANGSPVTMGTPRENVEALIKTSKEFEWD